MIPKIKLIKIKVYVLGSGTWETKSTFLSNSELSPALSNALLNSALASVPRVRGFYAIL